MVGILYFNSITDNILQKVYIEYIKKFKTNNNRGKREEIMENSNLLYLFRAYNAVTNPYASIKEINFSAAVLD